MGMLPGANKMKDQLDNFDDKELTRTEAIIQSMTPAERRNTKLLNGSRRLRIAKGAGMSVTDVNALVNRFEQAAKMMKTMAKGGVPNMPGMQGMQALSHGGGKAKGNSKKKGSKSGNPAKRAAENAALASGSAVSGTGGGSGFGLGGPGAKTAHTADELEALKNMLGRG
jgi:signal recognition particle subunit SRP54